VKRKINDIRLNAPNAYHNGSEGIRYEYVTEFIKIYANKLNEKFTLVDEQIDKLPIQIVIYNNTFKPIEISFDGKNVAKEIERDENFIKRDFDCPMKIYIRSEDNIGNVEIHKTFKK